MYSAFVRIADASESDCAVVDTDCTTVTYGDLHERVIWMAESLQARGIRHGSTVACCLENTAHYVAFILAVCRIGAIYVPISRDADSELWSWSLAQVRPELLVVEADRELSEDLPQVSVDTLARPRSAAPDVATTTGGQAGRFRMLWTSGSTGMPRRVAWRQDALLSERTRWLAHTGIGPADVLYCRHTLDVAHGTDIHMFSALLAGARLVLADVRAEPPAILEGLSRSGATVCSALPRHWEELARTAAESNAAVDLTRLRLPLCGGAYLSPDVITAASSRLGIHIRRIYGSTEFGMALGNMDHVDQSKLGMPPVEGVEVAFDPIPADAVDAGELVLRSPCTSQGCIGDDAKTAEAFRAGWYHTGDFGERDRDGRYRIRGRTTEVLAGPWGPVLAPQLESELAVSCPVDEIIVLASSPADYRAEALVLARPRADTTADAVRDAVDAALAEYDIAGSVKVIAEVPHIPVGKPDKPRIRNMWSE